MIRFFNRRMLPIAAQSLSGCGGGGLKREIRAGDAVWTPPGVFHWHGATTTASLSHLAVCVGDEEYLAPTAAE